MTEIYLFSISEKSQMVIYITFLFYTQWPRSSGLTLKLVLEAFKATRSLYIIRTTLMLFLYNLKFMCRKKITFRKRKHKCKRVKTKKVMCSEQSNPYPPTPPNTLSKLPEHTCFGHIFAPKNVTCFWPKWPLPKTPLVSFRNKIVSDYTRPIYTYSSWKHMIVILQLLVKPLMDIIFVQKRFWTMFDRS